MSNKEWVLYNDEGANLYQEMSLDETNQNPATFEIDNTTGFLIESKSNPNPIKLVRYSRNYV